MSKVELSHLEYFQNLHRLQTLGLTPPLLAPPQPSVLPPPYVSTPSPPHPPLTPLRPSPLSFLDVARSVPSTVAGSVGSVGSGGEGVIALQQLQPAEAALLSSSDGHGPSPAYIVPHRVGVVSLADSLPHAPFETAKLPVSSAVSSAGSFGGGAMQLQAVETPSGQCYVLVDPAASVASRPVAAPPAPAKFQQATFIPIAGLPTQPAPAAPLPVSAEPAKPPADSPYKGKRKACHNEVEKRRRDKINNWIEELNKLLPETEAGEEVKNSGGSQAPSKGSVLAKAVGFVHQLKETNRELVAENARLREKLLSLVVSDEGPETPSKRPRTDQDQEDRELEVS